MKLVRSITSVPKMKRPLALGIGSFDGVHLGHQKIIEMMKEVGGSTAILTFSNHPSEVIPPKKGTSYITGWEQKAKLLEQYGVDVGIVQPFSEDLATMTYELFLDELHEMVPFDHLFIGEDFALGYKREGTAEKIREYARNMHVSVHIVPLLEIDHEIVCSTRIRKLLKKGDLDSFERLSGRKFEAYVDFKTPFIDSDLLKAGKYTVEVGGNANLCQIDSDGNISLEQPITDDKMGYIKFIRKGS